MSKNNNNTPRLRFPGFTGEWEEKKLGDIGDTYNGLTGKSKEDFDNGNAKFITFLNVLKNVVVDTNILGVVNVKDGEKQNRVQCGDMLFNTSSETPEEVGFCSVFSSDTEVPVYLNSFCFGYRYKDKSKYIPLFLAYYLRSSCGRQLMHKLAQGITRFNLSKEYFNKAVVYYPSPEEQEKIASCLSAMDDLIAAQAEKVEVLKEKKTGLMQQLFPQPGETTPRLRFPEFTGEWVEKKLGEVAPVIFDGTHQTPHYVNSGIPFYSIENIVSNKPCKFITENEHRINTSKNKTERGDILISRIGTIGFAKIVDWDGEFSTYVSLATIKKSAFIHTEYLYAYLQSDYYQKEIRSKSLMNAVPCKINMEDLKKTIVLLPSSPAEQKKIADCLSELDSLIASETKQLEALKDHKKGLMQQLFPQPAK